MIVIAWLLFAFALGAVPFALLLGRALGVDIRQVGSGNVGATNLARARGVGWGVVAFVLDAAKGALPVWGGKRLEVFSEHLAWLPVIAGACAIAGHCFSPYLRFRGGKGVATAAGVLLALDAALLGILLLLWGGLLWGARNVGLASSVAALGAGVAGVLELTKSRPQPVFAGFLLLLSVLVLARHHRNLQSLFRRTAAGRGAG
ncbi:MAG: glycerol-3-phosphate acyltransferase [Planctomycetota bacterium]